MSSFDGCKCPCGLQKVKRHWHCSANLSGGMSRSFIKRCTSWSWMTKRKSSLEIRMWVSSRSICVVDRSMVWMLATLVSRCTSSLMIGLLQTHLKAIRYASCGPIRLGTPKLSQIKITPRIYLEILTRISGFQILFWCFFLRNISCIICISSAMFVSFTKLRSIKNTF